MSPERQNADEEGRVDSQPLQAFFQEAISKTLDARSLDAQDDFADGVDCGDALASDAHVDREAATPVQGADASARRHDDVPWVELSTQGRGLRGSSPIYKRGSCMLGASTAVDNVPDIASRAVYGEFGRVGSS